MLALQLLTFISDKCSVLVQFSFVGTAQLLFWGFWVSALLKGSRTPVVEKDRALLIHFLLSFNASQAGTLPVTDALLSPLGCILDSFCWHYEKENLLQHNPINYTSNSLFSLNARLVFRDENLLARVLIFLAWAWASSSSLLRKGFSWVSSTLMSSTLTLIILERMYGWRV